MSQYGQIAHSQNRTPIQKFHDEVIDDVIANLPGSFSAAGYGDSNLIEQLKELWRGKLQASAPQQQSMPQHAPMHGVPNASISQQQYYGGQASQNYLQGHNLPAPLSGAPVSYMPPPVQQTQSTPAAYMQQMGSHLGQSGIPQQQQYQQAAVGQKRPRAPGQVDGADDDDDCELNSDDDEEDDEPQTANLVLCQFEKVTRAKQRWKITLSEGIARLNESDTVFQKSSGELDF